MYESSLKFAITGAQHALQDVRQVSTKCIVELYKIMGEKVKKSFTDLRQAQIDQIETALSEANVQQPKRKVEEEKPMINIATNINPAGAKGFKQAAAPQ